MMGKNCSGGTERRMSMQVRIGDLTSVKVNKPDADTQKTFDRPKADQVNADFSSAAKVSPGWSQLYCG